MIEQNLGNIERVLRLLLGLTLGAWALTRPGLNGLEWVLLTMALAMILNGIFSRCYLWYIFDINTCQDARRIGGQRDCA